MRLVLLAAVIFFCVGCGAYTVVPPSVAYSGQADSSAQPFLAPDGIEFTEDYDVAPMVIHQIPPTYPDAARAAELEGMVILKLGLDQNGNVVEGTVAQGIPGLSGAALAAVREWRFKPASKAGKPVAVRITVPLRFGLRG